MVEKSEDSKKRGRSSSSSSSSSSGSSSSGNSSSGSLSSSSSSSPRSRSRSPRRRENGRVRGRRSRSPIRRGGSPPRGARADRGGGRPSPSPPRRRRVTPSPPRRDRRDRSRSGPRRRSSPRRASPAPARSASPIKRVVIKNLSRNVLRAHLEEIFSIYGAITKVDLPVDRNHQHLHRGIGYIDYESVEDAEKSIKYISPASLRIHLLFYRFLDSKKRGRSSSSSSSSSSGSSSSGKKKQKRHLNETITEELTPKIKVKIQQAYIQAMVDTGASISLISEKWLKRMGYNYKAHNTRQVAGTANGTLLNLIGSLRVPMKIGPFRIMTNFSVVENWKIPYNCILGMNVVSSLNKRNLLIAFDTQNKCLRVGNFSIPFLENGNRMENTPERQGDNDSNLDEDEMAWTHKSLGEVQRKSEKIVKIRNLFRENKTTERMKNMFYLIGDVVYRIPRHKRQTPPVLLESGEDAKQLIRDLHFCEDSDGFKTVMERLQDIAVWKGMRQDVAEVLHTCRNCWRRKAFQQRPYLNSIMTVSGRTHLPFVPVHLEGVPVVALLDSGASVSLIPERILKLLKLDGKVKRTTCSAKVANGTELKFLGKVTTIITVGKTNVSHELLITENEGAPAPCLLGVDFINALNSRGKLLTFNMTERKVKIGDTSVKLLDPNQNGHENIMKISVTCAEEEVIPPRCQAIIAGEMPGVTIKNKEFIITDTNRETDEIYSISSTLTKMDREGKVVVKITNPGNGNLVLRKGEKIAEAEVWSGITKTSPEINSVNMEDQNIEVLLSKVDLEKSSLSASAKKRVRQMIRKYSQAFVGIDGRIGRFKGKTKHYIELNDNHRIPQCRPYRVSPQQREKLEKELKFMKDNGLIEESTSPYTSPLLSIPKANGEIRIVIDYRRLNLITRSRTYIMPNTIDVTEEASRGKLFSVFDIAQGFHTIPMHEAHKERTAFCCHMGVFQYRYMPMGLKGAPDTFQRAMAEVEKQFTGTMILYVDDLIVVSRDEEEHLRNLEEFFQLMINMGLKLKAEKSQIGRTKISFLGFVIENNTIQPSGEKTEAIRKFPTPTTLSEVKSFLGMSGYFRRFIKDYAIIVKPLTTLTQKDVEFNWGEEQEKAFEEVKQRLISPPILTTPRMDGDFEMHTDASKIGIAAVLLQKQDDKLKVIAYASRPTTPVEQRYAAIESEALAITWGLTHYRPYIFGKKVKVVTDHQPLKSLLHRKEKEMSGRLLRHQAIIQMYDVEIVYRPGKENPLADALSRQRVENEGKVVTFIEGTNEIEKTTNLKNIQDRSKAVQHIKKKLLQEDEDIESMKLQDKFMVINDIVYGIPRKEGQLPPVIIEGGNRETETLIRTIHKANSHIGAGKMIAKLENIAIWNKMKSEIEKVISTCEECQRRKNPSAYCHVLPMGKWEIPNRPFQRIHIDVMGPLSETIHGKKLIIVATDAFSKFAIAKATANQTAETTLKFLLENIVSIHGIPEEIVTDQGTNFMSKMFEEVCRILEVKHSISTAYHHETNGAVERLNRTLEEMLTLSTSNPINYDNWDEKLPLVIQSYNAGYHSSVKYSPEYIVFGRMTVSPTDIMIKTLRPIYRDEEDMVENLSESIRQCHEAVYGELENSLRNAKKAHDKIRKVRVPIFEVGEKVVIQNPTAKKLMYQFSPPVTIVSLTASTITIRTDRGKVETVHKNRVKKFNEARPERDDSDDDLGSDTSAIEGSIGSMAPSMHQNKYGSFDEEMGQHDWLEKEVNGWKGRDRASTGDGQQHPGQLRRSRRLQNLPAELHYEIN
ncbi:hypothetical protein CRE_25636 [Caenorhabditis remanei]|uniref:RNA-directed DNA polymerase n=1 Tax=Caenorhabditis remanei TaxID=31234 RepID=E3ML55_CAERE|nr:hypothetical protein CRE_25636 [Caenorhabditis remanei]